MIPRCAIFCCAAAAAAYSMSTRIARCGHAVTMCQTPAGGDAALDVALDAALLNEPHDTPLASSDDHEARQVLDALDGWLRRQTVEKILPKAQARALLNDFREDRRFWRQQRRQ